MTQRPRLPDFLVAGATKCGTTSLHQWLSAHPQVWMPQKELRFFTTQHNWARGVDWYRDRFAGAPEGAVLGEASNSYTRDPVYAGVPERIAAVVPDVKILYMIRDPMKRLESHYRHRLVTGIEWRPPARAIRADPRYMAASLYGHQVSRLAEVLPAERILVLEAERVFAEPDAQLRRLSAFLGIDAARGPAFSAENVTADRLVAPWPIRRAAAHPRIKDPAKAAARAIARSPLRVLLASASSRKFDLPAELRADLARRFAEDRAVLDGFLQHQTAPDNAIEETVR